ncbi:MAG: hypothetical protein KF812_04660 [Fimbriimonadaceae bacterium]|nr:hypothetical protein [Fimbriimonadaceae bacterium]
MTTCNLTKPESTFDAIRKELPNMKPTDVALIATALVESGKFAVCVYDGKEYEWTQDRHDDLAHAYKREIEQVQEADVQAKKAKTAVEEPATLTVTLKPSLAVAEKMLHNREDLKTMVSDMIAGGIEFLYSPTDIGWPWTLERVNWATITGTEVRRRVRFRAEFEPPCEAVELSQSGKRKKK